MRNYIKRNWIFLVYVCCIVFLTYVGYRRLREIYFLNDEWSYIAGIKTDGPLFLLNQSSWVENLSGLHRPLGTLIQSLIYFGFKYTTTPFVVLGLTIHILNCLLVYFLAIKLTKNRFIGLLSGLLFTSSSAYIQALDWLACIIEIPASTIFALISIWTIVTYAETKRVRWFILAVCSAYIGFLIKDAIVFLFIVLPLSLFIYERKKKIYSTKFYSAIIGVGLLFIIGRILSFKSVGGVERLSVMGVSALFNGFNSYLQWVYRCFLYPLIGVIQIFIPMRFVQRILLVHIVRNILTVIPIDAFLVISALCILAVAFYFIWIINKQRQALVISFLAYILSFVPVALYFTQRGSVFIDERYLYFPTIFLGIMFSLFVFAVTDILNTSKHRFVRYTVLPLVFICFLYFYKQALVTNSLLNGSLYTQNEIKHLNNLLIQYSNQLSDDPIFYITSNRDYYFYPNHKLPFEQGTGFMLMTIFWETKKVPIELLRHHFLQDISSEGYQAVNNKGFGYFYDKNQLLQLYRNNPQLKINQIIGFYYDGNKQTLEPITEDIRLYIATMSSSMQSI